MPQQHQPKKNFFEFPLNIFLTDEGISSMMANNRPYHKIKTADKSLAFGFKLAKFSFQSIRKMLEMNYIQKMEMPICKEYSETQDIIDLTKLFIYNMFYRKFDTQLFSSFENSSLVENWVSLNTGVKISVDSEFKENAIEQIAKRRNVDINAIKLKILKPVQQRIVNDFSLTSKEKNLKILLTEKFLDNVRPVIWLCMGMEEEDSDLYYVFTYAIHELLFIYLKKAEISENLGVLIFDILQERENKSMIAFSHKKYRNFYSTEQLLEDEVLRRNLFIESSSSDDKVTIRWEIDVTKNNDGKLIHRMDVKFYSTITDFQDLNTSLNKISTLKTDGMDYEHYIMPDDDGVTRDECNNPYLLIPFLKEVAKENEMKFTVMSHKSSARDVSIISLKLQF